MKTSLFGILLSLVTLSKSKKPTAQQGPLFAVDWSTGNTIQTGTYQPKLNFLVEYPGPAGSGTENDGLPYIVQPGTIETFGFVECKNLCCDLDDGGYIKSDTIQHSVSEKTIEVVVNRHPFDFYCMENCGIYEIQQGAPFGMQEMTTYISAYDSIFWSTDDYKWILGSEENLRTPDHELFNYDPISPMAPRTWEIIHITYENKGIQVYLNAQKYGPLITENADGDKIKLIDFESFNMIFCVRGIKEWNPFFDGAIRSAALFERILSEQEIENRAMGYPQMAAKGKQVLGEVLTGYVDSERKGVSTSIWYWNVNYVNVKVLILGVVIVVLLIVNVG
eukprot:159128_1